MNSLTSICDTAWGEVSGLSFWTRWNHPRTDSLFLKFKPSPLLNLEQREETVIHRSFCESSVFFPRDVEIISIYLSYYSSSPSVVFCFSTTLLWLKLFYDLPFVRLAWVKCIRSKVLRRNYFRCIYSSHAFTFFFFFSYENGGRRHTPTTGSVVNSTSHWGLFSRQPIASGRPE